jgi:hypothetical protein
VASGSGKNQNGTRRPENRCNRAPRIQSSEKLVISQKAMRPNKADIRKSRLKDRAQKATNMTAWNSVSGGSMP